MPDDIQQTGAAQQTPASSPPPSPPEPSPSDNSLGGSIPPGFDGRGGQPEQVEWTGIRDYARTLGHDLSHYQDDAAAFRDLLTAHQQVPQLQQLARYGQEYIQHHDQFQKWLENQNRGGQQAAPAQQQPQSWWAPPAEHAEIQRIVDQWYMTDPQTGQLRPRDGAPLSAIQKVHDYAEYQRNWQHKLFHNPQEALRGAIQEEAKKLFMEQSQQQQAIATSQSILQRNADWLFYKDQRGTPMHGYYTPAGLQFFDYVSKIEQMGVRDPRQVEFLALSMLQRDTLLNQQAPQQPQQQPPQQAPYNGAGRSTTNREPQRQSVPSGQGGLAAMLAQDLAANGHTRFALPGD